MTNVADLKGARTDSLGQSIKCLYDFNPPFYAVYAIPRRVMIAYADASQGDLARQQRKALAELAPLRGEIDGLIDGWRQGTNRSLFGAKHSEGLQSRADGFNRLVAGALSIALEGDIPRATVLLAQVKQKILDERVSRARFEYLLAAVQTALALMFGSWLVTSTYPLGDQGWPHRVTAVGMVLVALALLASLIFFYTRWAHPAKNLANEQDGATLTPSFSLVQSIVPSALLFAAIAIPIWAILLDPALATLPMAKYPADYTNGVALWRAAAAGSVGAFFSIAIGIRGRTVLPDLLRTSNLMDAALRVSIGFIGGGVLMAFLKLGLVNVTLGANYSLNQSTLLGVLAAGFLAGFSERLVPDLLAKADVQAVPAPTAPPSPKPKAKDEPQDDNASDTGTAGTTAASAPANAGDDDSHVDGCPGDHAVTEDEATRDDELPPAAGGVAQSAEKTS